MACVVGEAALVLTAGKLATGNAALYGIGNVLAGRLAIGDIQSSAVLEGDAELEWLVCLGSGKSSDAKSSVSVCEYGQSVSQATYPMTRAKMATTLLYSILSTEVK